MGREIHYKIDNHRPFTTDEQARIIGILSGFDALASEPNGLFNFYGYAAAGASFEGAKVRVERLKRERVSPSDSWRAVAREGRMDPFAENGTMEGQTKTGDLGDLGALFVFAGLMAISKALPHASIKVDDEGEVLRAPLVMRGGLVRPDFNALRDFLLMAFAGMGRKKCSGMVNGLGAPEVWATLLPSDAHDYTQWAKDKIKDMAAWLPIYEELWIESHPDQRLGYAEALSFFVRAGFFIRPDCVPVKLLNDFLERAGCDSVLDANGRDPRAQASIADHWIIECIAAAETAGQM